MPSYSPVYSAQFIVYTSSTPNLSFEVPADFTAIVREAFVSQDIGGYAWQLSFSNSVSGPLCQIDYQSGLGVFNTWTWSGRVVVPGGGLIKIAFSSLGDSPNSYVGGYLLRNVAA